jgi:hypothetical protein
MQQRGTQQGSGLSETASAKSNVIDHASTQYAGRPGLSTFLPRLPQQLGDPQLHLTEPAVGTHVQPDLVLQQAA